MIMKKCLIILLSFLAIILMSTSLFASSNKEKGKAESKSSQTITNSQQTTKEETTIGSAEVGTIENKNAKDKQNMENQVLNNFIAPVPKKKEVEQKGEIKGKVLNVESRPVAGVTVKCFNEAGVLVQATKTDVNGEYVFKDLDRGKYKIVIEYQHTEKQIDLERKKGAGRAPIPTGLNLFEINYNIYGESFIRAEWDKMTNTNGYKCELLERKTKRKIYEIDGIKQNYCEFGNLQENKEYVVKVYSENDMGLSLSYALGFIRTIDKPPPPPYNLGYTYAKNNRIDLVWNGIKVGDLKGYVLQVKKENGPYLYYSNNGLVKNLRDAYLIPSTGNLIKITISGCDNKSNPIIENSIPYSFRVFEIDNSNNLSRPSKELSNVILEDTVPPLPITNIEYKQINDNLIRISWKTVDKDIVKYRLYYGVNKNRWDGVITTSKSYYDFIVDRKYLPEGKIYVAVTAIDRAGNESGYRPVTEEASIDGKEIEQKVVLSETNVYKDFSILIKAIKPAVKKVKVKKIKKIVKKIPPKPKKYGFSYLRKKGFVVNKGETATLTGKITISKDKIILVKSGGRLVLRNLEIGPSEKNNIWGGIRYLGGSYGEITNVTIKSAARAIVVLDNANIKNINNLKVYRSKEEALFISNSKIILLNSVFKNNDLALYIENSDVNAENIVVNRNNRGILASGYRFSIKDSDISYNKSYGLRLSGSAEISNCTSKENQVGIFIENSRGRTKIHDSIIDSNGVDGIVVENSNVDIIHNEISSNNRYGIYMRKGADPYIVENNITNNGGYGVFGGGKVISCYIAFNNGSPYIDETKLKGKIDGIFSSSSSDVIKQVYNADYIEKLSLSPIVLVK